MAFWAQNTTTSEEDAELSYSLVTGFKAPTWTAIEDKSDEAKSMYKGFSVNFEAINELAEGVAWDCAVQGPNTIELKAICGEETEISWDKDTTDPCNIKFTTTDTSGCSFDAAKGFAGGKKFAGAISIAVGIAMTFYGARFILYVLGFMIFSAVNGLFATVSYSLGYLDPMSLAEASIDGNSSVLGVAIGIGIAGIIVGGIAAYYLTKFANAYFLPIMAFACGGIATFMLTGPMKLN
jgi:hypothetical protein